MRIYGMALTVLGLSLSGLLMTGCTKDETATTEAVGNAGAEDTTKTTGEPDSDASHSTAAQQTVVPQQAATANGFGVFYVKANVLNVRGEPKTTAKVVGKLVKGQRIQAKTHDIDWMQTSDGGYVWSKSLSQSGVGVSRQDRAWRSIKR